MTRKSIKFNEKWSLVRSMSILVGPAGGSLTLTVLSYSKWLVEPSQALGVIQAQGKLSSNRRVKNWCKWVRKMTISQNPWIRLTSKQFSPLRGVKTYPEIDLLCQSMRFRTIPLEECICWWPEKVENFMKSDHWWALCRFLWALQRAHSPWRGAESSEVSQKASSVVTILYI